MDLNADKVLQDYFHANKARIEQWFNIITPKKFTIAKLKKQIAVLSKKDWKGIWSS
jgi:hypothetical protein